MGTDETSADKGAEDAATIPSVPDIPIALSKTCTIWTHEETFSKEDVLFNAAVFTPHVLLSGQLLRVEYPLTKTSAHDFQQDQQENSDERKKSHSVKIEAPQSSKDAGSTNAVENKSVERHDGFIFRASEMSADMKARYPTLQLSVSSRIAQVFGFHNRSLVLVSVTNEDAHPASHVELTFRDVYLARGDMWRLAMSDLYDKALYQGERLQFLNTVKATVKNIWYNGARVESAVFSKNTKPIFRSESARFLIYIQMSKEMWEFDVEGTGDLMFEKAVEGFLPELFKRWREVNAHHLVSIVLFTRMEYGNNPVASPYYADFLPRFQDQLPRSRDFYRVVVSDMASGEWSKILLELKREFKVFQRDVSMVERTVVSNGSQSSDDVRVETFIEGKPSSAMAGNILEAISLATTSFSKDYIDRDLLRTGISVIVITPGTGVFEVDDTMLQLTTDNLVSNGIGIDLVCLSPMPLHSTPLFKYISRQSKSNGIHDKLQVLKSKDGIVSETSGSTLFSSSAHVPPPPPDPYTYAMPHWIDISFWSGPRTFFQGQHKHDPGLKYRQRALKLLGRRNFIPRVRMYEAQMMGLMENEMTDVQIPYLHETNPLGETHKSYLDPAYMDDYDERVFSAPKPASPETESATACKDYSKIPGKSLRSSPNKSPSMSVNKSSPLGDTFLDRQMKEKAAKQDASAELSRSRKPSIASSAASTLKRGKPDRKQLLGLINAALQPSAEARKSEVSTGLSTTSATHTPGFSQWLFGPSEVLPSQFSPVSERVIASLSRKKSSNVVSQGFTRTNTEVDIRSHPISIQPIVKPQDEKAREEPTGDNRGDDEDEPVEINPMDVLHGASMSKQKGAKQNILSKTPPVSVVVNDNDGEDLPWLTLVNPCNPSKNNVDVAMQFGRWQHVFPRPPRTVAIKWKSLTSPAALPITSEYVPSEEVIRTKYEEFPYRVLRTEDDDLHETLDSTTRLLRELIGFRLSHGFQIVTPIVATTQKAGVSNAQVNVFAANFAIDAGESITMAKGTVIHELLSLPHGEIQVTRRHRRTRHGAETAASEYDAYIRTALAASYSPLKARLSAPQEDYNWNYIDNYLAGYRDSVSESLQHWRARFVLIPVDLPGSLRRPLPAVGEDSDEEIRIEGIQKLTQLWQRYRAGGPGEMRAQNVADRHKDPNPLAIEYQTRDPSKAVAAGLANTTIVFTDPNEPIVHTMSGLRHLASEDVDLRTLATELQGPRGIKMQDRRWHLRLHYDCFIGVDLGNWLLHNFQDINTREQAVEYGNSLMERGLFHHVQGKHQFRDGNFFYSLSEEYRQARPESRSGWFSSRKPSGSVPTTPVLHPLRLTTPVRNADGDPMSKASAVPGEANETDSPTAHATRPQIALSGVLLYDVNHRRRSYRPEVIRLHYDRLHNPENCYHIRIDWMNVTAKLIEDSIVTWANSVERFGLKLVEVPIAEAATVGQRQPFRSPYVITLSVAPPADLPAFVAVESDATPVHGVSKAAMRLASHSERHPYQQALLRKFDFVLDIEAASNFPTDVEVTYSWGKPDYRYSQYIHRTGVVLAQITDEGNLLLAANRMFNDRAILHPLHDVGGGAGPGGGTSAGGANTPMISASGVGSGAGYNVANVAGHTTRGLRTAEEIKDELEEFCRKPEALESFYAAYLHPTAVHGAPIAEDSIPMLELPAR